MQILALKWGHPKNCERAEWSDCIHKDCFCAPRLCALLLLHLRLFTNIYMSFINTKHEHIRR